MDGGCVTCRWRRLRTLGLFVGCGGLDLGFEQSGGFELVAANESWRWAAASYRANHPGVAVIEGDITKPETKQAICSLFEDAPCEAVIGGFPCQANSVAGNRDANDPRGRLYEDYIEVVRRLMPLVVVMENVPGILTMRRPDGMPVLAWIGRALHRLGYAAAQCRLVAADFGVPQARYRVFILAWRVGGVPYVQPTHDALGRNGLPHWRTLRDAVAGLPETPRDFLPLPERRLRYLRLLKAGQNWNHLPEHLKAEAMGRLLDRDGGRTACFRRLSWDKPSPTLTCSPLQKMTSFCHPDEDRPLSVEEYRRVQQFPDDYVLCGPIAARYAQLGNAVPVGLARAVALAVRGALPDDPDARASQGTPAQVKLLSNKVSKKGPQVFAWSIAMPRGKCPFASSICSKLCYANRARFRWNSRCYERNLAIARQGDFVDRVCAELRHAARRNPGETVACAIHEKGDFFSLRYLDDWREIVRHMRPWPSVRFFVYTRAWVSPAFMDGLRRFGAESAVRINLSTDREMLARHGLPARIGAGLVTYLTETDDDLPPWPVDLVFRNLCNKPSSPLERIGGCLVCPHESNLYFEHPEGGASSRIRCQACRLCVDRDPDEWARMKPDYAAQDIARTEVVTPASEPSRQEVTVSC